MNLEQYISLVIRNKTYTYRRWVMDAFAMTKRDKHDTYIGALIREPYGFFTIDENNEKVKLEVETKPTDVFLSKTTVVKVTKQDLPMIKEESISTTMGRLLVNLICLYEPFGAKLEYINSKVSPKDIEKLIAARLEDNTDKRRPDRIYVDEYLKFTKSVKFLESVSDIFVNSISKAGLLPAPGSRKFRDELLKKYEGKLTDPVESVKFEKELADFDKKYLEENDPSFGKFMSPRIMKNRARSYMSMGSESSGFSDEMEVTPMPKSLSEGIPLDKEGFTAIANSIRYTSYSRGTETQDGGVVAKYIQRASDNWTITDKFCNTTLTKDLIIGPVKATFLEGRWIREGTQRVYIETAEQAKKYVGTKVNLYSPQYCKAKGLNTCNTCTGSKISAFKEGIQIPLMNVSSGILTDSLKKMHDTSVQAERLELDRLLS